MDNTFDNDYFNKHQSHRLASNRGDKPYLFSFWRRYFIRNNICGSIIDVGCGLGYFLKRVEGIFCNAYGIDCSEYAVSKASLIAQKSKLSVGTAYNLDFADAYFDVLVAFDLIEHLQNPDSFFKEAYRVLKKNGIMILSTPNTESLGAKVKGNDWFGRKDKTHCSLLNIDTWKEKLANNHFKILRDGTDMLWDTPYIKCIPEKLQWFILLSITWIVIWLNGFYKWRLGENYYCILIKAE